MKKYLFSLSILAAFLFSCEKEAPKVVEITEMYFEEGFSKNIDEGSSLSLSQYLVILPEMVADTVTVNWFSSDEDVATVSSFGSVEAIRDGTVTITAQAMGKETSIILNVEKVKVQEFTIPETFEVYLEQTVLFPIEGLKPKKAPLHRFKWESTDGGPLPTLNKGKWYIKADKEREYTLTASVDNANDAKCKIKFVKKVIQGISIDPAEYTLEEGTTLLLKDKFIVDPIEALDTIKVQWKSLNDSIALVDENGNLMAVSAGKTTISICAGGFETTCEITVIAKEPANPENSENPEDSKDSSDSPDSEKPSDPMNPSEPEIPVEPEKITYTITFDANGGDGYMENITINEGESVTIPECTLTMLKGEFVSWNTSADGNGQEYTTGFTFTPTGNVTLYAKWLRYFVITFDANGGDGYMENITINEGESLTIPENVFTIIDGKFISWNTSESGDGMEYKENTTIIPSSDFTLYAQWKFSRGVENGYEWVDLGLSVKWATCNVGASSSSLPGDYYAWGEKTTKSDYSSTTYEQTWMANNLYADDDVAIVKMGGKWRMPTKAEFEELRDNCDWIWTTVGGVEGYRVTSYTTGNSIFLPAAGRKIDTSAKEYGELGYYYSSTSPQDVYNRGCGYSLKFDTASQKVIYVSGSQGFTIRAVLP